MKRCEELRATLYAGKEPEEAMVRHAAECATCKLVLEARERARGYFAEIRDSNEPSLGLEGRLVDAIHAQTPPSLFHRFLHGRLTVPVPAGVFVLAVLALLLRAGVIELRLPAPEPRDFTVTVRSASGLTVSHLVLPALDYHPVVNPEITVIAESRREE